MRAHLEEKSARVWKVRRRMPHSCAKRMRRLEHDTFDLRRRVAQSYREAMRDPLTGLPTGGPMTTRGPGNTRAGSALVIRWRCWSLDIDDFKTINDTFGHSSGDKALAMIGKILGERVRETDFIARYGGEEFIALLTGAQRDDVAWPRPCVPGSRMAGCTQTGVR